MKVYCLQAGARTSTTMAIYTTDNPPSDALKAKLAKHGLHLVEYEVAAIHAQEDWEKNTRNEVRIMYDMDSGNEWPEPF